MSLMRLMSEICTSNSQHKGRWMRAACSTSLDARLRGHDVIPAKAGIQSRAQILERKIETDITDLKSGQRLLQWMVGTNVALTVALLLQLIVVP